MLSCTDRLDVVEFMKKLIKSRRNMPRNFSAVLPHILGKGMACRDAADIGPEQKNRLRGVDKKGDVLRFLPEYMDDTEDEEIGMYISGLPLSTDYDYFEVEVSELGWEGILTVGLVPANYPLTKHPGWSADSVGYHADSGRLYINGRSIGSIFGPKFESGDKVGCGLKFPDDDKKEDALKTATVFFTLNGVEIGTKVISLSFGGPLYPAVGFQSVSAEVRLFEGIRWAKEEEVLMAVDGLEEEWSVLHEVSLNGQLLEYAGRGKEIYDGGLAQAAAPLTPTNHYFELEIINPGEHCYIAIGLAREGYPRYRHPGWKKESIAYHADDGKLFSGNGRGNPFGPKCHKGDIMGCGILFPPEVYNPFETPGDSEPEATPESPPFLWTADALSLQERVGGSSSSSESLSLDENRWDHVRHSSRRSALHSGEGLKVQVYFTRNGCTLGKKEVSVPAGGFFPVIGMMSKHEKVRVDLHPLTG